MSIEWGLPTVWDLLKGAVILIKRPVKYATSSKSFADRLREEVGNLGDEVQRVNFLAERARNNVRKPLNVFTTWEKNSNDALKEAQDLLKAFDEASKTCCYGTLPDPYCRYQFSTKAEGKIEVIQELAQKCSGFMELDDISFIDPAPGNVTTTNPDRREGKNVVQPTTATASASSASTSNELSDDGLFESRAAIIRDIMVALADDSNSVVGIHGMGGVGKTTLLVDAERRIREEKLFDLIAKADVSQNPDITRIQGEIADALGLGDIKNKESVSGRAELLHRRLDEEKREKKKVLIILDNLWEGLDLKSVGIPCGHDNKVMGCKLLLTSRYLNILQTEMGCDGDFLLGELQEEEARGLFERMVGDKVNDEEFRPLVDEALRECAGLPLLIVTMAKRFKCAPSAEWRDALNQIGRCTNKGISAVINKMLQLSYDHLESEEAKSLLQLCVTYGVSNPSVENLVRYSYGLGIFPKDSSMKEARDGLSTLIRTLQASSLLLDNGGADGFKIHDLVRHFVAQFVLRDRPLLLLKDETMLATQLQKETLKSCTAICFPYIDMKELPEELDCPDCPDLRIFLLFNNNESLEVPDSTFNSMGKLAVLNLTSICLTRSQTPFQPLKNLHTLSLHNCSLEDVAILGELKGLQILSIVNSKIRRLPKEIGQLVELRLLDLSQCTQLEIIEPGVLQRLIKLEELYMENSFHQWNAVEQTPPTNASLIELNNMKNLCTLHIYIPNPSVLPKDLNFKQLTKYEILIGFAWSWSKYKGSRTLQLKLNPTSDILQKECIQSILCKTDDLFLDELNGIEQSICRLSLKGFPQLKHLRVVDSPSVRYIFEWSSPFAFKKLETLLLKNLDNLEKICDNHISTKSFSTLKVLRVMNCDKMEVLFPRSLVRELPQLEEIKVESCKLLQGILEADDCGKLELPNLRVLKLHDLPNINNFFSAGSAPSSSPSNDQVDTQIAFFNGQKVSIPSLESLTMEGLPNLKEIWSDESPLELSNLQSLEVVRCDSLSKLISSRLLVKLNKLSTLTIKDCISVQEIFDLDGPSASGNVETVSELTTLELNKMRNLKCIWSKSPHGRASFYNLKKLEVDHCDNLGFIFFPSMVKNLAQLRDLMVRNCNNMEAIITEEEWFGMEISETLAFPMLTNLWLTRLTSLTCFSCGKCSREARSQDHILSRSAILFNREVAFPRLETLVINDLNNIRFVFSPTMVKSLAQLKKLKVLNCKKMEAIITKEEGLGMETAGILAFPMLTDLSLGWLKSLTCFSRGKWSREARSQDRVQSRSTVLFNREVAFSRLETLEIIGLHNFGFVFSPSMVKSLPQLKKLTVWYCEKMETIVTEEEGLGMETAGTLAFLMLIDLRLIHLESLTCFARVKCYREAQSQDRIKSYSTALFNREVAFPNLETLSINGMDNIEMIWDNQVIVDSFHSLKSLDVEACNKLKCIWDKELHCQVKFHCLRFVSISRCKRLTSLFPARDLMQLEELKIDDCGVAELIEKEEGLVPRFVFPNLTSLKLKHLTKLKCLYTGTHTSHWPALKTLEVDGCNEVEILASQIENEMPCHKQPLFLIEKGSFRNLQELKLDLLEPVEIWHGQFNDEEFFRKLRVLKLHHLTKESLVSTYHFVESLTNLEELIVCESYLEGPSSNEGAIEGTSHQLKLISPFSRYIRHLQTLDVSYCDGLSNMFTPTLAENLVALTKLRISNCRILTEVLGDEEGEEGCVMAFNQLKYMELDGLKELRCFSSSGYTLMFPLLEDIIVDGCPNMKVFSEGPIEAPKLERVQVSLERVQESSMILYGPPKYQYFWKGNLNITIQNMFEEMATVAMAKFMRLFELPELIGKWHSELNPIKSSWQLENLVIDKCPSFINAIPSKLMLILEKMTSLQVLDCESMEEIFDFEGLEAGESTRVLPRLRGLNLVNLPKLRQLWNKDLQGTMCFDSLSNLTLYKCSNLRFAFTPSMARCLANLWWMEIKECGQMEGVIIEEEGQGSAVEKITFPKLLSMKLQCLPNLTSFLSGKDHTLECPQLNRLTIAQCPKMRSLTWQSSMDIDHGTPSLFTPQVQFPQLWSMVLSHMDNLSKIWTDSPLETLTFKHLWKLEVQNCKSLENLFPHRVATNLTQLKKLQVESCQIEEIVASGDDTPHSNTAQVLFPKLISLVLHDMPRLKSFCPNLPTLNWPLMKEWRVTHCDKLNMLSFAASMNNWAQRDDQHDLSYQEAQSSLERDFPNLERLLLVNKDVEMVQDGKLPYDSFGKPKALTLACFHDENAIFPSRFLLERFQNLQSLEIFCSSFQDIFLDERLVDEGKHLVLENLRELKLSKLHNLQRVWREDYLIAKILQGIKKFEVWDCPCLTTIFPTVTSFQNLTELVVKNSSGLVHLVTVSAITNLVHFIWMTIIGCERMKEVVANDGNEKGNVISLGKLRILRLQNLPSLECFSSATSCSFRFPSLWEIEVEECPKMKIFSKGMLSTPKLCRATLFRYNWDGDWEGGDLNATMQKLSA